MFTNKSTCPFFPYRCFCYCIEWCGGLNLACLYYSDNQMLSSNRLHTRCSLKAPNRYVFFTNQLLRHVIIRSRLEQPWRHLYRTCEYTCCCWPGAGTCGSGDITCTATTSLTQSTVTCFFHGDLSQLKNNFNVQFYYPPKTDSPGNHHQKIITRTGLRVCVCVPAHKSNELSRKHTVFWHRAEQSYHVTLTL